jgi:hypothetical protein
MARMIDMIRSSSVPATLMHAAARGALSVPPAEMIEIMVHLANHNKVFGQQARMTLAGWEEKSSLEAASDPNTPREVLDYLIAPENLRPRLLPALLENPSISDLTLMELASKGSREVVVALQKSPRVQQTPVILKAVASNPSATKNEVAGEFPDKLAPVGPEAAGEVSANEPDAALASDPEVEETVTAYLEEHAHEIAADEGKPFQPLGGIHEFESESPEVKPSAEAESSSGEDRAVEPAAVGAATTAQTKPVPKAAAAKASPIHKKTHLSHEEERGSALQKISKLDIKGRIQLAMKGSKEDRSILIRDSTKLVALAVLESPKITDGEVEKIANQKNVLEAVLRQIPMKRRFMKNYGVVRNLVGNPRTPLDVSLGLMKNLLTADLRNLSGNKEVSDTIRKLALKMFKQKMDPTKR